MLDRIKLPAPRPFFEREIGELRPSRRDWALPKNGCPFHNSKSKKSFYVNLQSGGYFCFSCGASGGDVLSFVMRRDRIDFKTAAQRLGAWTDPSPEARAQAERERNKREKERAERNRLELAKKRQRIVTRDQLHSVEKRYGEARQRHDIDVMAALLPQLRQLKADYMRLAGLGNS